MKHVKIIDPEVIHNFESIEDYLVHMYGEKKLNEFRENSSPTFIDVVGYTTNKNGYETLEEKYYELHDIENMMKNKWKNKIQ